MAQATWMLWNPSVSSRGRRHRTARRRQAPHLGRAALRDAALPARDRRALPRRRRAFRVLALIFVGYETVAAWIFAGTTRYRVPWDFVLALLAAAALARLPFVARVEAAGAPRRRARSRRPARSARCSGPRGSARRAPDARLAAHRRAPRPGRSRAGASPPRAPSASPGATSRPGLALAHEVLEPADRRRDHRPRALHRLERDHAEALAERRHDDGERLLDRRAAPASRGRGSAPPRRGRARARGPSGPCSSTPRPAMSSRASGRSSSTCAERAQQHDVALDRDQAADAEEARRAARRTAPARRRAAIP